MKPIHVKLFYHEGRGPELEKVHYRGRGRIIEAIDYYNPDDEYIPDNLKHLFFIKAQVFMFTPEEVYAGFSEISWAQFGNAAIICLEKSKWLDSFNPLHLSNCQHYRIMFYDEYLDVICEGIDIKKGGFEIEA